ncbi:MAG: peptidyl-prolyl cis-trans isomerase [Desulfuromonadales bacterium]|nr:peptidyl-prolyl cis-trans isomerase [Desulfuromonadales bacterium]
MQKSLLTAVTAKILLLLSAAAALAFGGGGTPAPAAPSPAVTGQMQEMTIALRPKGAEQIERIPLFSEKYAATVVATVNGEAITLRKFAIELAKMHSNADGTKAKGKQNFAETLERLIAIKLVKQEALNIGFDKTPEVQSQIENFALKTMIQQLLAAQTKDLRVEAAAVDELYRQMALEAKLLTYRFLNQADAEALLKEVGAGGDFKALADRQVKAGKAEGGEEPQYARLNDLLPAAAQAVYTMRPGEISQIFKADKGFMLFRLEDRRNYEDPAVRQAAADRLMQQESRKQQLAYLQSLEGKYVTFDKDAEQALNFAKILEANPQAKGAEVFAALSKDQRPLATISNGRETVVITVAEVAKKLESSLYHGMDRGLDAADLDKKKGSGISNRLVAVTGRMEAQGQGIDKTAAFQEQLADYTEGLLFETFMAKAVVPGVSVREEDVRAYYDKHLHDFSSPLMLKMKSLAFTSQESARAALKKLQTGSDFKWVSANATDLADADNKEILALGDALLAITALPDDLHHQVEAARQGDLFLYAGPGGLYYTLVVESAYPPVAKPYEEVRQEIGRILYAEKIKVALADWVTKLKEAYPTENFLVPDQQNG